MPGPTTDWNTVNVHGKYIGLNNEIITGSVTFTPTADRMVDADALVTIIGKPLVAQLNSSGEFSVDLPATDDPDITPINFTYKVVENFDGGSEYHISVPVDTGPGGIDISTVAHEFPTFPGSSSSVPPGSVNNNSVANNAAISLDKTADGTSRVALSPSQRNKLDGIQPGATANQADAVLLDRANHEGTQGMDTIEGLSGVLGLKADLDPESGIIPSSQLPPLTFGGSIFVVNSQSAMLALSAVQGDIAKRTDFTPFKVYMLGPGSPATLANWVDITPAGGTIESVNGQTGPTVVVTKADVGLSNVNNTSDANKPISTATQTALNGKSDNGHTHSAPTPTQAQLASLGMVPEIDYVATGGISGTANSWPASRPSGVWKLDLVGPLTEFLAGRPTWQTDNDHFEIVG